MKVIESYWKDTVAGTLPIYYQHIIRFSGFLAFLQIVMQYLFDQTKERYKIPGFTT